MTGPERMPGDVEPDDVAAADVTPDDVTPDEQTPEEPTSEEPAGAEESAPTVPAVPVRRAVQVRRVVGRASSALVVLGAVAGLTLLGDQVPPAAPVEAAPVAVPVGASTSTLVCPGPVRLPTEPEPGQDVSYDPQFDPAPQDSQSVLRVLALDETAIGVTGLGAGGEIGPAAGTGGVEVDGVEVPAVVQATPVDGSTAQAAGAIGVRTADGDLRGLVAASCQRPGTGTWLVGGSTSVGSSARLVLQNPGRTPATVQVDLWGEGGQVELAGAPQFLVPAGSERVVLLEGVATGQRRLAVRLTTSGGLVTAYLQDSALRGLVPAGVDLVVGGHGPATTQAVPGVVIPEAVAEAADTAVLRVLAPGERRARVDVRLLGPDGPVDLPGAQGLAIEAGTVVDLPLAGVPAGAYTVVVEADQPVVAGAMLTRGAGGPASRPLERAWVPSAPEGGAALLVLPQAEATVVVGLPERAPGEPADGARPGGAAQVRVQALDVQGRELGAVLREVREGSSVDVDVLDMVPTEDEEQVAALRLETDDPRVVWSAVLEVELPDGLLVATVVPVPAQGQPDEVAVRVR